MGPHKNILCADSEKAIGFCILPQLLAWLLLPLSLSPLPYSSGSCCLAWAAAAGPVASSLPLLVRFNNVNNLILCLNGAPPFVCQTWGIQKEANKCACRCVCVYACLCMFLLKVNAIFEARGRLPSTCNDFYWLISFL